MEERASSDFFWVHFHTVRHFPEKFSCSDLWESFPWRCHFLVGTREFPPGVEFLGMGLSKDMKHVKKRTQERGDYEKFSSQTRNRNMFHVPLEKIWRKYNGKMMKKWRSRKEIWRNKGICAPLYMGRGTEKFRAFQRSGEGDEGVGVRKLWLQGVPQRMKEICGKYMKEIWRCKGICYAPLYRDRGTSNNSGPSSGMRGRKYMYFLWGIP